MQVQAELDYREALRLGQREVAAAPVKNETGTLPVLDELIPPEKASRAFGWA